MKNRVIIALSFWLLINNADAQGIKGKVTNSKGEELPYTNVYIKNTTIGTSCNLDGNYNLTLANGSYEIVFQALGFEKKIEKVVINNTTQVLNCVLTSMAININEITISSGENPANAIMQKVIKYRKKHLNEIKNYKCEAYIKGINRILKSPKKFMGQDIAIDGLDSTRSGVIYFSECISTVYYEAPEQYNEEVIASKVSGDDNGISLNRAQFFDFNLYKEQLELPPAMAPRALITPTNSEAFLYYDFTLIKTYTDGELLIDVIKYKPKRKHDNAFEGLLYISNGDWHITSAEILITKNEHLNLIDTLTIKQNYTQNKDKIWALISQQLYFKAGIFLFKFNGNYEALYTNYEINTNAKKSTKKNELMKADKDANTKDSIYWVNARPVELSDEERLDYINKDSIAMRQNNPAYIDSIRVAKNKFKFKKILNGYTYTTKNELMFETSSLTNALSFNTVQGLVIDYQLALSKTVQKKSILSATTVLQYGLAEHILRPVIELKYRKKGKYTAALTAGNVAHNWGDRQAIQAFGNTITTLLFEKNYLKLYNKQFVKFNFNVRPAPGLRLNYQLEHATRSNLHDKSNFKLMDYKQIEYTDNKQIINPNRIIKNNITIKYTPNTKYITMPEARYEVGSSYPTFTLLASNTYYYQQKINFTHIAFKVNKKISTKTLGNIDIEAKTGFFVGKNKDKINPLDYNIFTGNLSNIITMENNFFNLEYDNGTQEKYVEAHAEWNAANIIGNKIPFVRKLKISNTFGVNSFYVNKNYNKIEPFVSFRYSIYPITIFVSCDVAPAAPLVYKVVLRMPFKNKKLVNSTPDFY